MKIISGGQTGVDRAALDVAIELGIPHGGWCPKGRRAELDTVIPEKYHLQETESDDYSFRTKFNIRDSEGTLIIIPKTPLTVSDGTVLTIEEVKANNKPFLIIDLSQSQNIQNIVNWIRQHHIVTLNVAGPRESQSPGIYELSYILLKQIAYGLII